LTARRLPGAAFAVLVVLTVAAFFITQHLKTVAPPILWPQLDPGGINPVGGRVCPYYDEGPISYRRTHLSFELGDTSDTVEVDVVSASGRLVDTISSGRPLAKLQRAYFAWDGRNSRGRIVSDGIYYFRVVLEHEGFPEELTQHPLRIRTHDPKPRLIGVNVSGDRPGTPERAAVLTAGRGDVVIHFEPDHYRGAEILIYRRRPDGSLSQVDSFYTSAHTGRATWNGRIGSRTAPPGTYVIGLRVKDIACNLGTTPARTAPAPDSTRVEVTIR